MIWITEWVVQDQMIGLEIKVWVQGHHIWEERHQGWEVQVWAWEALGQEGPVVQVDLEDKGLDLVGQVDQA